MVGNFIGNFRRKDTGCQAAPESVITPAHNCAPIYRAGALCGIMFCVSGPRATEFTAVWENDKNRVFFYGPTGERTRTVNLSGRVALE